MDGVIDYIFSFFWISHKTSGAGMDRFMNFRFMSLALIITEWYDLCVIPLIEQPVLLLFKLKLLKNILLIEIKLK